MTYSEVLHCSAHCNDDIWFHASEVLRALKPLQKSPCGHKHENLSEGSVIKMGYRKKPNFTDIDNLNDATESYYEQQRKMLGKSFQIAYIWDVFARYIVIGIAIVAFLLGLLTGWMVFGSRSPNDKHLALAVDSSTQSSGEDSQEAPVETTAPVAAVVTDTTTVPKETTLTEEAETTAPEDGEQSNDETTRSTTETSKKSNTTTAPRTTESPVVVSHHTKIPAHTAAPIKTTIRTTVKTTAKTTIKTTVTTKTTTTTARPDTSNRILGVTINRNNALESDGVWRCTFTATLKNNRDFPMSSQLVEFDIPGGCSVSNIATGGTAELSGTLLTLKSSTSLAPGATKTIVFTLESSKKIAASNFVLR